MAEIHVSREDEEIPLDKITLYFVIEVDDGMELNVKPNWVRAMARKLRGYMEAEDAALKGK